MPSNPRRGATPSTPDDTPTIERYDVMELANPAPEGERAAEGTRVFRKVGTVKLLSSAERRLGRILQKLHQMLLLPKR